MVAGVEGGCPHSSLLSGIVLFDQQQLAYLSVLIDRLLFSFMLRGFAPTQCALTDCEITFL